MDTKELATRYRNLLIVLARYQSAQLEGSQAIRQYAEIEPTPGRKAGLLTKANSLSKQAYSLRKILYHNKSAMRFFFESTDIQFIARQELSRDDYLLTILQQSIPSDGYG